MVSFTKGEIRYMAQYITKKQQVQNLLKEIENVITSVNADIAIPVLQWTKE